MARATTRSSRVAIVQVPFPSTAEEHPLLASYYRDYSRRYQEEIPGYFVPEGELWELPLWAAHLSGMLRAIGWDSTYIDLSTEAADPSRCVDAILAATSPGDHLLFSPLAQNFGLVREISRRARRAKRRTMIGGNMAPLTDRDDADRIVRGIVSPETLMVALGEGPTLTEAGTVRRGSIGWTPRYRQLAAGGRRPPLLRLNASHGCLFNCAFCGDAWSRKLFLVKRSHLAAELDELADLFPTTKLLYIGDKSFGQAAEAIVNLKAVLAERPGYRLIVQTHFKLLDDSLMETLLELGVSIVELGFESADPKALRDVAKANGDEERVRSVLETLHDAGLRTVLNVLGGLPSERRSSHEKTVAFMHDHADLVWLYNLYNFVPYPLTPLFPRLRDRIFDWDYSHWREDAPPVFTPFHLSAEESWELFLAKVETAQQVVRAAMLA